MAKTTIEWTGTKNEDGTWSAGYTFNPWWGCTKVSDGCKFCYAQSIANRYGHDVWGVGATRRTFSENHWREPLRWNRRADESGERLRVFCASMADVFDPEAPTDERERLWELIRKTPHLDWQILTKRPQLIAENLPFDWENGYPNVWLGTSVEDERVVGRIAQLVNVPSVVHFLSLEPLIGPLANLSLEGIEWAIVGGESGPGARPMQAQWVEEIRLQCETQNVPFFFKQWGGVRKKQAGRELNGRFYDEMPRVCQLT